MESRVSILSAPEQCPYLNGRVSQMRYELGQELTAQTYASRLEQGWRRFGPILFRNECPSCRSCQSLRVPVAAFRPSRSQQRVWRLNQGVVSRRVGVPTSTPAKLELFRRFHLHGHRTKGWPFDAHQDLSLFTANPFPTEEWIYGIGDRMVAVGYVDVLAHGLSAIYCFHDPEYARHSLGTFNILTMIDVARARALPYVYLGYVVDGCRSLEYKARFRPHERLTASGDWISAERSDAAV